MKTSPVLIAIFLFAAVLLAACGQPAAAAPIVPDGTVPANMLPGQLTGLDHRDMQVGGALGRLRQVRVIRAHHLDDDRRLIGHPLAIGG